MQKILITGGAGFIGSHLVDHYMAQKANVTVIDNCITGRIQNLRHHFDKPNFRFIVDTVTNKKTMAELVAQNEVVLHLAAPVGVKFIMQNPVHTLLDNMRGIDVVLELCNKHRTKTMVASTSEIYGRNMDFVPTKDRLDEDSFRIMGSTKSHRWAYANTKAYDEFLAFAYQKEFGLPIVITRFFNTVGPRQIGEYGMVVPSFVKRALNNEPIQIYGTGKQTRCFAYVKDVVKAVAKLMRTPKAYGDVYNIGGTEEISMLNLAKRVIALTKSKSKITFVDYETAYGKGFEDMLRRTPDTARLKKVAGFTPDFSLNRTLKQIIQYHRSPA